ncbi:uncharacterized protein LOC122091996 isoform X2 [Macadamia integrifolia]|uniref:uncharacterized protein LOC122091996 isoform X2 n=1 Tax=Macadamia integrifolia TaxID=60698 RepID=UPI001C4FE0B0|nr:uncharacterized protein LOC122091996 isoform X2 [Macadamia integrifolia]
MEGPMETNVSSVKEGDISMKSEESSSAQKKINPVSPESEEALEGNISLISPEGIALYADIPTLTEENYKTWKEKMEKFLKKTGLCDYLNGVKREPEDTSGDEYNEWEKIRKRISLIFFMKYGVKPRPFMARLDLTLFWSQLDTMYEFTYPTEIPAGTTMCTMYTWCLPFYSAIVDGNWKTVSEFLSKNKGLLTARLTSERELPLHVAVKKGKVEIAKELMKMMSKEDLLRKEKDRDRTVLHIAVVSGNKEIVKAIIEKDEKLVMMKSKFYRNRIPIAEAAVLGNKDLVNYLYPITMRLDDNYKEDNTDYGEREKTRASILTSLIDGDFFGQALDLLKKYPSLILTEDYDDTTAMDALSKRPTSFKSSLPTISVGNLRYYFVYSLLDVHVDAKNDSWRIRGDVENSLAANRDSTQQVPGCKHIYEEKLKHYEASELLRELWRKMVFELDELDSAKNVITSAMFRATQNGCVEFIQECITHCPHLLSNLKFEGQTVFHFAISYRQEKIYRLINHLDPSSKNDLARTADNSKNWMSHLAAKKAPIERLNQVPGAALQMQRELLWYKEVESIMYTNALVINKDKKTSRILFTEEHKDLVKEGATWLKETSTQCMVVATLITTIMFQAVFTVPSHTAVGEEPNNYIQGKFPIIFVISNIMALCSSVASMLMFLAIITSRYAEEDFLSTLPRMLMLGLLFLFFSIVGMMVAFVSAILFMLRFEVRLWGSFPIVFLASIPVTIYALVEFPLFIQLMFTTSSSAVFGKRKLNNLS